MFLSYMTKVRWNVIKRNCAICFCDENCQVVAIFLLATVVQLHNNSCLSINSPKCCVCGQMWNMIPPQNR